MDPVTNLEFVNVGFDALCDIVYRHIRPACLIKAGNIICSNTAYNEKINGMEPSIFLDDNYISNSKELAIQTSVYTVWRIKLTPEILLIILDKKKEIEISNDPLTGLLSRDCFEPMFGDLIRNAKSNNEMMSILFVDLDGFKLINDTYGHEKGDLVLKTVAERLRKTVHRTDPCFRLGGDEFVILLKDIKDRLHPCLVARRLIHTIGQNIILDGSTSAKVGASIGIASFPHDGMVLEELLKNADEAMYRAKKLGKNNYQLSEH